MHPVEAYGLRVTVGDATLAYTGDTGPCEALDRLAAGADLLLAEASFRARRRQPGRRSTSPASTAASSPRARGSAGW